MFSRFHTDRMTTRFANIFDDRTHNCAVNSWCRYCYDTNCCGISNVVASMPVILETCAGGSAKGRVGRIICNDVWLFNALFWLLPLVQSWWLFYDNSTAQTFSMTVGHTPLSYASFAHSIAHPSAFKVFRGLNRQPYGYWPYSLTNWARPSGQKHENL